MTRCERTSEYRDGGTRRQSRRCAAIPNCGNNCAHVLPDRVGRVGAELLEVGAAATFGRSPPAPLRQVKGNSIVVAAISYHSHPLRTHRPSTMPRLTTDDDSIDASQ